MRILAAFVFAILAIVGGLIWYEHSHPCMRYDPQERVYYQMVPCGKGCTMMLPTTYHECLERK